MIEQAIVQAVTGRDGQTQPYHRPREIREVAKRIRQWRRSPEACWQCRDADAVMIHKGRAYCAVCRDEREASGIAVIASRGSRPAVHEPELRQDGDGRGLAGHWIVFDKESVDLGGFTEIIRPSAVDDALRGGDEIVALWSHESSQPLGRAPNTLYMRKDRIGLYAEVRTPKSAADKLESVERGDVRGASFGFVVTEDVWNFDRESDSVLREVLNMRLIEISAVTFPAYPQTRIRVEDFGTRKREEIDSRLRLASA